MFGLLEIDYTRPIESVGEKLLFGGQMLLIGIGVVFSVLVLLWLSLELFRIVCDKMKGEDGSFSLANLTKAREPKPEIPEPKPAKPAKAEKKAAPPAPAPTPASSDTEIIAVITAAIAASENAPLGSFRVVSFRRV